MIRKTKRVVITLGGGKLTKYLTDSIWIVKIRENNYWWLFKVIKT